MKKLILLAFIAFGIFGFGLEANASGDGNRYMVFNADQGELFQEAGKNCCAGDKFTIVDVGSGEITEVEMLSNGPNASCN